jgi:hypothetical protein
MIRLTNQKREETIMKAFKFALAAGIAATVMAAVPAYAQFTERNIRLSNGVNEDHPKWQGCR